MVLKCVQKITNFVITWETSKIFYFVTAVEIRTKCDRDI